MYRLVAMFGPKWDAHGVTKEETRKLDESVLQTIENTIDRTLEETTGSLREFDTTFVTEWNRPLQDGDELYL